jgi:putative membrane protein
MPRRRLLRPRLRPRHSAFDEYTYRRLILTDYLAIERTRLANERTILSYLRTGLGLTAGALTLLHFFDTPAARITAWLVLAFAALLLAFGFARYVAVRRRVAGYARLHTSHEHAPQHPAAEPTAAPRP